APPFVFDYEGLQNFHQKMKDTILVAIDLEAVDHLSKPKGQPQPTSYEKLSEVGMATFDPRQSSNSLGTLTSTSEVVAKLSSLIKAYHTIRDKYANYTEETCPAFYHKKFPKTQSCQHSARPYHCAFARSVIDMRDQALKNVADVIKSLCLQSRTSEEIQRGDERQVCILYWAAGMEESVFGSAGINLADCGKGVTVWDFQLWSVFQIRFSRPQTKGEAVFASLGALGRGEYNLHNATNDCVAQVIAFLRVVHMQESEWATWFDRRLDLAPLCLDWIDPSILKDNFSMRPLSLHGPTPIMASQQLNNTTDTSQPRESINRGTNMNTQPPLTNTLQQNSSSSQGVNRRPAGASTNEQHPTTSESKEGKNAKGKDNENIPAANVETSVEGWWAAYEASKQKVQSAMAAYMKPTTTAGPS
ncbi:hypothetical protein B0T20DRAFT_495867, partial [Sordaria brevicollis]